MDQLVVARMKPLHRLQQRSSAILSIRSTTAANSASQYQKLSQPFRSPLINSNGSKQHVHSTSTVPKSLVQLIIPPSPADASTSSSHVSLESVSSLPTRPTAVQGAISMSASNSMSQ